MLFSLKHYAAQQRLVILNIPTHGTLYLACDPRNFRQQLFKAFCGTKFCKYLGKTVLEKVSKEILNSDRNKNSANFPFSPDANVIIGSQMELTPELNRNLFLYE